MSLDASLLRNQHLDAIGELIDNGGSIWLGIVPGTDADLVIKPLRDQILGLWRRLGFSPEMLSEAVVPTPSCGLAGASPDYVRAAMSVLRDLGHSLLDGAE